jgi:hypothetical protein
MDPSKYDPNAIIMAAEERREQGDITGAHMIFESALLDWADDAREGAIDPDQMQEAIATLWLGYAEFHKTCKMVRPYAIICLLHCMILYYIVMYCTSLHWLFFHVTTITITITDVIL